jgi:predicted NAD/FAD-binding protein
MSQLKVAIIGSGISGLTVASQLHPKCDIQVFEAGDYIGGHTHTLDVEHEGKTYPVNTGFIVYNDRVYTEFNKLLAPFKLAREATMMSFSVSDPVSGLEYNGRNLSSLFAQRSNLLSPRFYRMIFDILRFNKQSQKDLADGAIDEALSLGQYLEIGKYSKNFIDHYIVPMGAAIWSSGQAAMLEFPALLFIRFFKNHGLLGIKDRPQWYVLSGGSRSYVEPLTRAFADRIHTNSPVASVDRYPHKVSLHFKDGSQKDFDEVVFACHSDQALKLLKKPSAVEQSILGDIDYAENEVVLHTDESLLPKRKLAWAAWNYHLGNEQDNRVSLTYNMNILQNFDDAPITFCVTLNRSDKIDPSKVIARYHYAHPVFNSAAIVAQSRFHELVGANRSHYCGAYWFNGFHEDGVRSGLRVASAILNKQEILSKLETESA